MMRLLSTLFFIGATAFAGDVAAGFEKDVRPLLDRYCADCHDEDTKTAFRVDMLHDFQRVHASRKLATKVVAMIGEGKMPPKKKKAQPTMAERQRLMAWVESVRADSSLAADLDPGHVVLRRLSRYEYAKTIRDLFNYGPKRAWTFFVPPGKEVPERGIEYSKRTFNLPWNLPPDEIDYGFDNIGEVLTLPPHLMESYFEVGSLVVDAVMGDKRARESVLKTRPGDDKSEHEAARQNLALLTERAFRRPITDEELQPLLALFALAKSKGESFENAMKVPMRALLVSPDFLYRVQAGKQGPRALGEYELASRLSYFLWSSMPDAELFRLAREGKLSDPMVLEQQVQRMLRDPKIEALAEHFAPLWLRIEDIQAVTPDPALFPSFYRRFLAGAMRTEAIIFFDSVVVRDRSIIDLVDSDSTFINDVLGSFYGLPRQPQGKYESFALWRETPMPETRRGGVLTMAATAAVTSNPTRSSPVKRGKWVLETILGDPPPPPPPDVEPLKEDGEPETPKNFREKLEHHRANPNCASCHERMDPIGFALEHFDAIGRWRDHAGDQPVDAKGHLKDGTVIEGSIGLKAVVLKQKDDFARCLTEHFLTYALGRKLEWYDEPAVERIVEALPQNNYRFSKLIREIALSRPFRHTR